MAEEERIGVEIAGDGGSVGGDTPWRGFSLAAGAIVLAFGCAVLVGWLFDLSALKSIDPAWVAMKANTALSFALSGLALFLLAMGCRRRPVLGRLAELLAAAVILIGAVTLVEYISGVSLGIDELFFRDAAATIDPGRMAPMTAVAFVLAGLALALAVGGRRPAWGQSLAFLSGLLGALALLGYVVGEPSLGSPAGFVPMAAHTAAAFTILCLGVLALSPAAGWVALVTGAGRGAREASAACPPGSSAAASVPPSPGFARARVNALFVGGVAVLALVVLLSIVSFQRFSYDSQMRIHTFAVLDHLDSTFTALLEGETSARGYALTGSEEYLGPYEQGRRSIMVDLAALRDLTADDPEQQQRLTTCVGLTRQRLDIAERLVEVRRENGLMAAQRFVASGVGKSIMDEARQVHAQMVAHENGLLAARETTARRSQRLTVVLTTGAVAMAFSLFLVAFAFYYREQRRREALQVELVRAKDAAEAANQAKSEFLANTSHEVRTPMNAILGMTDLVLETPLTAEQKRCLGMVREAAESLLGLLNDLLDFAKMEAGKLDLEETPFALREVVEGAASMMGERARRKGLELVCGLAPEAPDALVGDPGRLRQILVNIVGNAIKFTAHGEVVIRVEVEEEREHDVTLRFSVTDTGIGISPDKLKLIFDPFRQADASVTRAYGGSGLGLAISAELAARMQGRLWAESEVGKGSVFRFTLRFGVAEGVKQRLPARLESLGDMRVLVVDDYAANRLIYGELMTAWTMRPTVAESGAEALAAAEEALAEGDSFALALLDDQMPAMDGYQLAERLRGRPELADLVILMLSSGGDLGDAGRRRDLGIAACLAKPVRQSELLNSIMRALGIANGEGRATEESAPIVRPLRVLLAEDHPMNQELAVQLLTKRGHTVTVAGDGREAVERLSAADFDVVLMDIQMPVMDGFAATAAIRDPQSPVRRHDIPIVAMTAHAMKGDRERCLAAGMDAYVSKPISAAALMGALADLFGTEPPPDASQQGGGPAQPPPPSAAPVERSDVFDRAAVLERMAGDEALAKRIAQLFLDDLPALLADLEAAAQAADLETLIRQAHTLKGNVATLGGFRAQQASLRLETAARRGDIQAARGMVEEVRGEVEALAQAVRAFVRAEGAGGDET